MTGVANSEPYNYGFSGKRSKISRSYGSDPTAPMFPNELNNIVLGDKNTKL